MERLAQTILEAARIREESFDHIASYQKTIIEYAKQKRAKIWDIVYYPMVDYSRLYKKSLRESCDEAAEEAGFDTRGTEPIYLLLVNSWNGVLYWAKTCLEGTDNVQD